jgi:hypothetical protein
MNQAIAIKILLTPLAGLALGVIAPAVHTPAASAEGTWIEVSRRIRDYQPGTLGEVICKEDRNCGEIIYVDARSIVRRGDYAYYNWARSYMDKNGFKTNPNKPLVSRGSEANCRSKTVKIPNKGWISWSDAGEWESPAARFACR